jgi:hypothetical protein
VYHKDSRPEQIDRLRGAQAASEPDSRSLGGHQGKRPTRRPPGRIASVGEQVGGPPIRRPLLLLVAHLTTASCFQEYVPRSEVGTRQLDDHLLLEAHLTTGVMLLGVRKVHMYS